jgi:hypothetical protein
VPKSYLHFPQQGGQKEKQSKVKVKLSLSTRMGEGIEGLAPFIFLQNFVNEEGFSHSIRVCLLRRKEVLRND